MSDQGKREPESTLGQSSPKTDTRAWSEPSAGNPRYPRGHTATGGPALLRVQPDAQKNPGSDQSLSAKYIFPKP